MRIGELFAGYGGLGMGVQAVLGGDIAWHSEVEPAACRILAHHWPGVPNLGDITQVDWDAVEPVDVLTGGFPCQDVSAAGKRLGMKPGTRSGLWAHMAYAIDRLRPRLVVAENVRGLLSAEAHSDLEPCPWCVGNGGGVPLRALGGVLGDLADLGYDARWHGLRAADVGAPHGRFRVFVVAWPADPDAAERRRRAARRDDGVRAAGLVAEPPANADDGPGLVERSRPGSWVGGSGAPADAERGGRHGRTWAPGQGRRVQPADGGRNAADADLAGLERPEPAAGRLLPDGGATSDAQRDRRAGWPEEAEDRRADRSGPRPSTEGSGSDTLAHSHSDALREQPVLVAGCGGATVPGPARADAAADTQGDGRHEGRTEPARLIGGPDAALGGDAPAYPDSDGREVVERVELRLGPWGDAHGRGPVDWGPYAAAVHRWERLTRPAPAPTEPGAKGNPRLSPAFVEWLMGLPAGHVTAVPGVSRNEQLKALGNGVVPQQAAEALRRLLVADAVAA